MRIFSEGIARRASSYRLVFDAQAHRVDSHESAYRVVARNALDSARRNVIAELELHAQSGTPEFVRSLFQAWHYFLSHPLKFIVAIVLMILIPWLFLKVSFSEMLQWFEECSAWLRSI